jgi:hypothetical protein
MSSWCRQRQNRDRATGLNEPLTSSLPTNRPESFLCTRVRYRQAPTRTLLGTLGRNLALRATGGHCAHNPRTREANFGKNVFFAATVNQKNSGPRGKRTHCAKSTTAWLKSTGVSQSKERNSSLLAVFDLVAEVLGDIMKIKLFKTLLTAVLTSVMALGTGTSLVAQDQSTDKPSAAVSAPVDQGAPPEQPAPPQDQGTYQDQAQAPPPATAPNQPQYTSLPPEQLNELVAPIALYPDSLVAQVLAASEYPTQIVEADRMVQANPGLKGRDLAQQADQQDWDPSVKALVEFPTVLANLDKNLSWTSELGEAYRNQPDDVMQAVQYMRHKAYDAGNLRSTPQERVYEQGPNVDIQPADPDVVYVPTYNPAYVYGYPVGFWPGFHPWWGFGGPYISFGIGFPVWPFFGFGWGWHGWGIGWGFHGGVFFGGHPYAFRSGAFYNHAAFVHGNYRGFSSAHGAFGAHSFADRGARGFGSAASHGYAGASRGYAGTSHSFAGSERGATINRSAEGNRGYAGNRGFSGGERAFSGRGSSAPRASGFSGTRGSESRGSSSHGSSGGSRASGHSSSGHASSGHGGGGGHSGGGHGGRR